MVSKGVMVAGVAKGAAAKVAEAVGPDRHIPTSQSLTRANLVSRCGTGRRCGGGRQVCDDLIRGDFPLALTSC